ncbi:MAG: DUF4397 domain-containing protein [Flavobacterium sp.]|nr:MAG: DUF4397 domain-containing protein [Flavobacterium sp.]
MKINFFKTAFLGLAAVLFASCSVDDGDYYYEPTNSAYGLIANASPSSGDLYFFADANQVGESPFSYSDARGYYNFFPGDRTLTIKDDLGQTLATAEITLELGEFFSAFAVNTFDNLELVVYEDNAVKPEIGLASVRFINLSPDATTIDIDGTTTQSFASGLEFKQATQFQQVNAGTYDFNFSNTADGTPLATQNVQLLSGRIYTIYTKGFVTPPAGSNDTFSAEILRNY